MVEGKYGGNSSNLPFKLILGEQRRRNLIKQYKSYKNSDTYSSVPDEITASYSKLVKNIRPEANFDWRKDPTFNS